MGKEKVVLTSKEKIITAASVIVALPFIITLIVYLSLGARNLKMKYMIDKQINSSEQVLFLGDSLIEYCDFSKFSKEKKYINAGIAGLTSKELKDNAEDIVKKANPRTTIILIGTNDIPDDLSNEDIVKNIIEIALKSKVYTNGKVYVQSLYPVIENNGKGFVRNRTNRQIDDINAILQKKCTENGIHYLNIARVLKDSSGSLNKEYSVDGLHVNKKAYSLIFKIIDEEVGEKDEKA